MHRVLRATACTLLFATCAFAQSGADVRSFDSGGVPISYIDRGSGQPVLLLHGFTRSFRDWETGLIPQLLADGFRVIAYDSRGHGSSGKPDAPAQYGQEDVNDAIRLLDHLGVDNAHIVGYSRGASIASRIVAQRPRRARSVVFGGWGTDNPVQKLDPSECEAAAVALERGEPPIALLRAVVTPGTAPPLPPSSPAGAVLPVEARRSFAAAFRSECHIRHATIEDLDAAHVPAIAIVGALDGMLPAVKSMAVRMPSLKVVVLPNANHLTAPSTGFVEAVAAFLREQRAPKK
jgi:pimeloyl-ACP methyl ester carboxylesterase